MVTVVTIKTQLKQCVGAIFCRSATLKRATDPNGERALARKKAEAVRWPSLRCACTFAAME